VTRDLGDAHTAAADTEAERDAAADQLASVEERLTALGSTSRGNPYRVTLVVRRVFRFVIHSWCRS
jgi:hypothetical protein